MSKVLYIKANMKPEGQSNTFKISDKFIESYKSSNPDDEIITLDLYKENIKFLSFDDFMSMANPDSSESSKTYALKYAYEFLNSDKIIVAAPMWNLGTPAILKAYLDYVAVAGVTFKYTATGPVGLCQGRKALFITTRGGDYSNAIASEFEMGERYLKTIFNFLGIEDFQTISAEKTNVQGLDTEAIVNDAINKAINLSKSF